jgi:uncharacterized protein YabN with tetrapyrrole methylase and pyrophosphatase domain
MTRGSLCAVGIGIRAPAQSTLEATARIERAEKVFSLVADPIAEYWIRTLNADVESLARLYAAGKDRKTTYEEMVDAIVGAVRRGSRVCAVAYGHPGVAAFPLHESVRVARATGYPAEMLAGISAADCLFADLGVDPVAGGFCSYEATDFLVHRRTADPASNVILWQIGAIAERSVKPDADLWSAAGLAVLTETLLETYSPDHEVVVYEAARLSTCEAIVQRIALGNLPSARVTPLSTLFVPPRLRPVVDDTMLQRLGLRTCLHSGASSS